MVQPPPVNPTTGSSAPQATTLQQDPVCGTYVSADTSLKKIVSGHVYHFCSAECRAKFQS
jgi:YHS domain-containing protein